MTDEQPLRADARRNRARVLEVAAEAFAAEGLSVPVREIARRAEVGTGTVSRHFPTKEHLFEAILRQRVDGLIEEADRLAAYEAPGPAFFLFFTAAVHAGAADRGLAERLTDVVSEPKTLGERARADALCERLGDLLEAAQRSRAVRADVVLDDVETLMVACMTRQDAPGPIIATVTDGLRPELPEPRTRAHGPAVRSVTAP